MPSTDEDVVVLTPCRGRPELFFSKLLVEQKQAKGLCRRCPFRAACLRKAFRIDAPEGVWGGFDEIERSFYRQLYGDEIGKRVQELPPALVKRIEANRVMRTGADLDLAMEG